MAIRGVVYSCVNVDPTVECIPKAQKLLQAEQSTRLGVQFVQAVQICQSLATPFLGGRGKIIVDPARACGLL